MKKRIFLTLLILSLSLFQSCKSTVDYSNKSSYDLKIGEELNLYFTTNSCCFECVTNLSELKHLSLIDEYFISDDEQKDCEGCNRQKAFKFIANSVGIDTIRINSFTPNEICNDTTSNSEQYIISVQ